MGEEIGASRPSSSTAKTRDAAKKRAALWKKQIKSFKLKDVGKKVDAVRFCAQDERFFREQAEVLPLLVGFLSRTKTPELVMETLSVMHTLLSPSITSETNESETETIHPELNAAFILDRSVSADSAWKAGEPFINLFNLATLSPEIRIKAIEVFDLLLRASIALSVSAGEATTTLLQFQSVGSPCSALLCCLVADNGELQFAALLCLRSLMKNSPNEEFLEKFEAETGVSRTLEFVVHSERRFHRPALDILERLSHFECGREYLRNNGTAKFLRDAIQEAQETMAKTSTIVPVSGMDSSPLSSKDAPLLCANIEVICQVFVRMTLAKEQVAANNYASTEDQTLFMDFIDAGVAILQYDINSALNPVPAPTESPRTTGGAAAAAAAAANAAATNAAALASLLPFSMDRCSAIISSVGRLVEHSERCKVHAKSKGILPVLLDCFKVKEADKLYQVADKLLHLCVHVGDAPEFLHQGAPQDYGNDAAENGSDKQQHEAEPKRIDPNILCAVATGVEAEHDVPDAPLTGERPPLVAVDAVLALLEASHVAANQPLIFRHLRWIAALVDLPGNAHALGERAVSLFLQILADTPSSEELRFAFLAKCIRAIVLQNSAALELCGSAHLDPSAPFFSFLRKEPDPIEGGVLADSNSTFLSQPIDEDPPKPEEIDTSEHDHGPVSESCRLEWIDEYDEQAALDPNPLTESCHDVDVYLSIADALTALTGAFLKWNSTSNNGSTTTTDFSELIASKLEAEHISSGKAGIAATTAGSKKKLATDPVKPSAVGEAVMLAVLEKGMQVPKLVSKYAAVNPSVCVTLLELLNNLMTVPGGLKVLLNLAKAELQTHDQAESSTPGEAVHEWPLSAQLSAQSEHACLLSPVLGVLQSPDTSFIEIEAAVRTIAVMTCDLEPADKEPPTSAPEPVVETAKSPTKGAAAVAPPPPAAPTVPELVAKESDRFINAALGCGALVLLLAFMDQVRLPVGTGDSPDRVAQMETQIEEMVTKFITLAQMKQEKIIAKYREKLEHDQPPNAESPPPTQPPEDPELPYQARWAQLLLDHKFSVPRFGYESYSALLLASELALPKLVSSLLNAGACSETASPEGVTPLMIAFLVGNEEMVIDLLDARADVNAITKDGRDLTVWNCALASPLKARVSSMITKAYASSDAADTGISMSSRIQLDSIEGSLQFLDMCLDAGVDANVSNAHGDFLLHALLSKSIVRRKLRGLDLCFRYNSYYEDLWWLVNPQPASSKA